MKRFLVLCLIVAMCYAAVTGTIAYFTDSVETSNVVASGNLHVVQHEYERDGKGVKIFQQEKKLYPAVNTTSTDTEEITMPNGAKVNLKKNIHNYVDKIVTAENKGSLQMYVRTYIAVPSFSANDDETREEWIHLDVNAAWEFEETPVLFNQSIDGMMYDIYMATYLTALAPNDVTPPSLLGFYMDSKVTNDGDGLIFEKNNVKYDLGNGSNMKILVSTVASQAAVFEAASGQSAAMVAMDATYPDPNYHPWSNTFFVTTQTELNNILNSAEYDTIISLAEGTYTIPAQLPAGLRITGAGAKVTLNPADAVAATDVEFDHVIFSKAFVFTGWGSFEEVDFVVGTTINATQPTVLVDCVRAPAPSTNVTIVNSLPTEAPTAAN